MQNVKNIIPDLAKGQTFREGVTKKDLFLQCDLFDEMKSDAIFVEGMQSLNSLTHMLSTRHREVTEAKYHCRQLFSTQNTQKIIR